MWMQDVSIAILTIAFIAVVNGHSLRMTIRVYIMWIPLTSEWLILLDHKSTSFLMSTAYGIHDVKLSPADLDHFPNLSYLALTTAHGSAVSPTYYEIREAVWKTLSERDNGKSASISIGMQMYYLKGSNAIYIAEPLLADIDRRRQIVITWTSED